MNNPLMCLIGSSLLLAGCGQSGDGANNAAAAAPPPPKKHAAYCFFKPEEMKAWTAKRDKDGTITVKGKAHVKDPRYNAIFGPATITGTTAEIAPTISQNTGYEAPGDWWDLSASIPNSSNVDTVKVTCGDNVVANLTVAPKKS